jgi:hypothetical protein
MLSRVAFYAGTVILGISFATSAIGLAFSLPTEWIPFVTAGTVLGFVMAVAGLLTMKKD